MELNEGPSLWLNPKLEVFKSKKLQLYAHQHVVLFTQYCQLAVINNS